MGSPLARHGAKQRDGGHLLIKLAWGSATDAGSRRERNEDAHLASGTVVAVADGMGGHERGDLASQLAIGALSRLAEQPVLERSAILDAIRAADTDIVQRNVGPLGMGTTVTGLAVAGPNGGNRLVVFNVGDSRTYRFRHDDLVQITADHSVVQELIDAGVLAPADSHTHPERHVITRSLGSGAPLEIDYWVLEPQVDDRYLVTSDGLTKELTDHEIRSVLGASRSPQAAADALVAATLEAGARDNVTVVVVDVVAAEDLESELDPLDADTNPRSPSRFEDTTVPPVHT